MKPKTASTQIALALVLVLALSGFTCNSSTKKLAVASDAISHALLNAQQAAKQGVSTGVIAPADEQQFEAQLARVSQAGLILNDAIRKGESAATVSAQVNVFLDAFNALSTSGVAGIKNPQLQLTISTILTGAESSVAIIAASVGGGK